MSGGEYVDAPSAVPSNDSPKVRRVTMMKRIALYGAAIVFTLVAFMTVSDRIVVEAVPLLASRWVRFIVVLVLCIAFGTLARPLFAKSRNAKA